MDRKDYDELMRAAGYTSDDLGYVKVVMVEKATKQPTSAETIINVSNSARLCIPETPKAAKSLAVYRAAP